MQKAIRVVLCLACWFCALGALAQTTADKKQALAGVHRIVVIPPFFGTPTLLGDDPAEKRKKRPAPKLSPEKRKEWDTYREYLQKLEQEAEKLLPTRLAKRTRWEVLPKETLKDALKTLELSPQQLFENKGYLKGTKFPPAHKDHLIALAKETKADAFLLTMLDEPLKITGGVVSDGFNLYYETPQVRLRGNFIVVLADGKTLLSEAMEVVNPYTKRGNREYLLTDWQDAQAKLFENFMDELNRYTPPPP